MLKSNYVAGAVHTKKLTAGKVGQTFYKFQQLEGDALAKELGVASLDDLPDGFIAGWASTPDKDLVSDVVMPGAFKNAIGRRGLEGPMGIKLLIGHDPDRMAGKITKLVESEKGLWIEAQLNLEITYVKDAYLAAKMQGGVNFSIGYRLVKDGFRFIDMGKDDDSYWELSELDLFEVSVVSFPANEKAYMTFIKDAGDAHVTETVAEFEKALVASGLVKSRNDAQKITRAVGSCKAFHATKQKALAATSLADTAKQLSGSFTSMLGKPDE